MDGVPIALKRINYEVLLGSEIIYYTWLLTSTPLTLNNDINETIHREVYDIIPSIKMKKNNAIFCFNFIARFLCKFYHLRLAYLDHIYYC